VRLPLTLMHLTAADEGSDIEHIWQTTWRIGFYRGGPVFMSALSGIDIALWDLKGTSLTNILFVHTNGWQRESWEFQSTSCWVGK
jgi:L-alanine-DL-glutamate epimerase-like enolase superfamily enzyme